VKELLGTSGSIAFKIWKQSPPLKYTAWFLALAAVALIIWLCVRYSDYILVNPITLDVAGKWILGLIVTFIATYFFGWLVKVVRWRETLTRIAFGIAMSIFGWVIARIHLHVFDKMFLKRGSLDYFHRQK